MAWLPLCIAAGVVGFSLRSAWAQPLGLRVQAGSAQVSTHGNETRITTAHPPGGHSSLQWQAFSIPAGHTVRIEQPSAASWSIQRVIGDPSGALAPSVIEGSLLSNGRVALVNPAGILVGPGALVDTAGFTASTLDGADAALKAGRWSDLGRAPAAPLTVQGRVIARHGDVVLLAGALRQEGHLSVASGGAEGGRVLLQSQGTTYVSGKVQAQRAAGQRGGQIDVLGSDIWLAGAAHLDVSAPDGGGQLRVGGDARGANPELPHAQTVTLDAGVQLRADATQLGTGGRVMVWSDRRTRSAGAVSARGGPLGGNGGQAEVSSRGQLDFRSRVDLRAPAGRRGHLLLDPSEVWVLPDGADTSGLACADSPCDLSVLWASDLEAQSALSDLEIIAGNRGRLILAAPLGLASSFFAEAGTRVEVLRPVSATGDLVLAVPGSVLNDSPPIVREPGTLSIQAPLIARSITLRTGADPGSSITLDSSALQATGGAITLESPLIVDLRVPPPPATPPSSPAAPALAPTDQVATALSPPQARPPSAATGQVWVDDEDNEDGCP